jgi:D-xylose transport system permease protein
MTGLAGTTPSPANPAAPATRPSLSSLLSATEINLRLFGMVVALAVIFIVFGIATGGKLLQPTSLITLSVQASVVAVMATGMVLVIVSRNIDLSVGSVVGVVSMSYALLMTSWLPGLGLSVDSPVLWIVALALGLALGLGIGAFQGFVIAYVGVPSFIVTLGGLLALRGVVWVLSGGAAVTGLDPVFQLLGGGATGSIGGTTTWAVAIVASIAIIALLAYNRRRRRRYGFPVRPLWAEVFVAALGSAFVLGAAAYANASYWPTNLARKYAIDHGIAIPPGGLQISNGFPWPVLMVIGVTIVMAFIATRLRFGRSVYAIGGNPDAAALAGINTRWTIMKIYMLMGLLCGIAGAIAAARLNGATLDVGQSDELYVIAAAVVGGTSFAGGIGTIPGAILGAIVMQSLAYGLSFIGVNSPVQNIIAGVVLVLAVGFDTFNRRRSA